MPRITVKSIPKNKPWIYENVLNYVAKPDKCNQGYISATELLLPHTREEIVPMIGMQIETARTFYGKNENRLGMHVIIEFSPDELKYLSMLQILAIGHHIAQTEFVGCMTYFAVHDHTENLHLDMLLIPINIREGIMYGCNRAGWNGIETRLLTYLKNFMPEEAVSGFQVSYQEY